ncbi:MAG: PEP-CTERM sorting domain-containing protein [Phycisphaerae bacterium]
MVTKSGFVSLVAAAVATIAAGAVKASVITGTATLTESSTAPTGTVIAANLPSSGITTSTNPNYYTGTQISPMPGEIFTTGSAATSITDVVVNLADAGNVTQGPSSALYLYLGTASGTNAFTGTVYEYGVTEPSSFFTKGDYLDFTLATPFTVSPNTQYAYVVSGNPYSAAGAAGNSGTYMGLGAVVSSGNGTASQGLGMFAIDSGYNSPTANAAYNTYNGSSSVSGAGGTDNAVFEVLGTTVPEPSTLALALIGVLGMGLLLKPRKMA